VKLTKRVGEIEISYEGATVEEVMALKQAHESKFSQDIPQPPSTRLIKEYGYKDLNQI
jgi:hypothetical protein